MKTRKSHLFWNNNQILKRQLKWDGGSIYESDGVKSVATNVKILGL